MSHLLKMGIQFSKDNKSSTASKCSYVCCEVPGDTHSVLSGVSRTSKFYVKEGRPGDRKITLRVRGSLLIILS